MLLAYYLMKRAKTPLGRRVAKTIFIIMTIQTVVYLVALYEAMKEKKADNNTAEER